MILDLALAKKQCRIDSDMTDDDTLLQSYISAAESAVTQKMGRKLFATSAESDAETDWSISYEQAPEVQLAVLLLIGHFWRNREATTEVNLQRIPLGVDSLLAPWVIEFNEYPPEDSA